MKGIEGVDSERGKLMLIFWVNEKCVKCGNRLLSLVFNIKAERFSFLWFNYNLFPMSGIFDFLQLSLEVLWIQWEVIFMCSGRKIW